MRFSLTIALLLCSLSSQADWTGVAFRFADTDSDWDFDGETRRVRATELGFRIEEKTESELRVGASFGHINLRVDGATAAQNNDFDTQFLSVYLRQPIVLNNRFALFSEFNYRFNSGRDSEEGNEADIEWSEIGILFGASVKFTSVRISPLVMYEKVDGDISADSGTQEFELDDPMSAAVRFDFFVDRTAFVRLEFQAGNREGVLLYFAREY